MSGGFRADGLRTHLRTEWRNEVRTFGRTQKRKFHSFRLKTRFLRRKPDGFSGEVWTRFPCISAITRLSCVRLPVSDISSRLTVALALVTPKTGYFGVTSDVFWGRSCDALSPYPGNNPAVMRPACRVRRRFQRHGPGTGLAPRVCRSRRPAMRSNRNSRPRCKSSFQD